MSGKDGNAELGERLRAARDAAGWTQRDLAARLDIALGTIAEAEGGRDIRHSTLCKLLHGLPGLSAQDLLPTEEPETLPSVEEVWELPLANIPLTWENRKQWGRALVEYRKNEFKEQKKYRCHQDNGV